MRLKQSLILLFIFAIVSPATAQRNRKVKPAPQHSTVYVVTPSSDSSNANSYEMVYGIGGGITFPFLKFEGPYNEVSGDIGFKGGLMWGLDWGFFEFVPEIWYSTFNMGLDEGINLKNRSIDMPLMVGFEIFGPVKFKVGPSFSLICNNDFEFSDGSSYEIGRIKSTIGGAVGVSIDLVNNLFIDLRYTGYFMANSYSGYALYEGYDVQLYSIDITAGFRF